METGSSASPATDPFSDTLSDLTPAATSPPSSTNTLLASHNKSPASPPGSRLPSIAGVLEQTLPLPHGHGHLSKLRPALQDDQHGPRAAHDATQLFNYRRHNAKVAPINLAKNGSGRESGGSSLLFQSSSAAIAWFHEAPQGPDKGHGLVDLRGRAATRSPPACPRLRSGPSPVGDAVALKNISFSVSKLRPFVSPSPASTLPSHFSNYGPKVKAAAADSKPRSPIPHETRVHVPLSRVRPAAADTVSTAHPPRRHHGHLSKVRAIRDESRPPAVDDALRLHSRCYSPSQPDDAEPRRPFPTHAAPPATTTTTTTTDCRADRHRPRSVDDTTTESRRGRDSRHLCRSASRESTAAESQCAIRFNGPRAAHDFIHAPVPISVIKPAFQDHAFSECPTRSTPGSAAPADTTSPALLGHGDVACREAHRHGGASPPFEASSRASRPSPRSSIFNYRRTAQWLREVLKHPELYTARLTERPARGRGERRLSVGQYSLVKEPSAPSMGSSSKLEEYGFQDAVDDLERLLSEALAVASQAIDEGQCPLMPRHRETSLSLHSFHHSVDGEAMGARASPAPQGLEHHQETEDARPGGHAPTDPRPAKRPGCRHAATLPGPQGRPRFDDMIRCYSGRGARTRLGRHRAPDDAKTGRRVSFHIPRRVSSRSLARLYAAGTSVRRAGTLSDDDEQAWADDNACAGYPDGEEAQAPSGHGRAAAHARAGTASAARAAGQDAAHGPPRGPSRRHQELPEQDIAGRPMRTERGISLKSKSHVSLPDTAGFSLAKSRRRQGTARDWSPIRKRFVAAVACASTALVGVILGIYSGLVPSIQYYIIDESHTIVHGNTGCFAGLALPTFFLWPLPLLHGRKPYILSSLVLSMPLLFPQALAVNQQRLTDTTSWRAMLLASRTAMGCTLGFASINFHSTLTDLFGASLMSVNPHQEVVDRYDARRHGGGMGVWLGIWTWCWIGSIGVGFLVGACIIDNYPPAWGFYVSIMVLAVVLFLNVVSPEVRRSAFRRSVAEVRTGSDISRRVARGEVMMHRVKTGPVWWGQEVYHGIALSLEMLRQPGFTVMALYVAWIYAQVVLIIVLLGSLTSRFYRLRSTAVGLLVGAVALGSLLAIPFQKANLFSRSRQAQMNSNLATLDRKFAWSSHLVRRAIFTLLLPLAGICYAAVSSGPPIHLAVPTIFATLVGFLSCLAIAECNGLVMETFDCSDLSPGMTGRRKGSSGRGQRRANYSSFPRVTAGFAVMHTLAFILAAGATALGGLVTRTLGQQVSTGVVAGILLLLTSLLLLTLVRFAKVQIVPQCKSEEMDRLVEARRRSTIRRASTPNDAQAVMEEEMAWRPAMIGNPTSRHRRMNLLELGSLSRWQEIRRKNKLIDRGAHVNRDAVDRGLEALDDQMSDLQRDARELFGLAPRRGDGRGPRGADEGSETADDDSVELDALDAAGAEAGPLGHGATAEDRCAVSRDFEGGSDDFLCGSRRRR